MEVNQGKHKILIVEDEIIIAADLEYRLEGLGFSVCGLANTGKTALEMAERNRPDLIMMDIVLQGEIDGIETAEIIRERWDIPVVFLTAYANTARLERAKLAYPFGYLLKPFEDKELKITLEMALYVSGADKRRRDAERALSREAAWRRILAHGSRDGIVVLDQDGSIFEANKKFMDILGYSQEEVHSLHVWDWDAQWDREHLLAMLRRVDEQGDHFETRHIRKDGSIIDVEISTNSAIQEGKKLIFCVCRDITGRKETEIALRESEEKYRLLVEHMHLVVGFYNLDGVVLHYNKAAAEYMGGQPEKFINRSIFELFPEKAAKLHYDRITAASKSAEPMEYEDYISHLPTGCGYWFKSQYHRVTRDDGDVIGVQTISDDITSLKVAESELRKRKTISDRAERMANLGSWEWEIEKDQWTFSNQWLEIHGCRPGQYTMKDLLSIAHPDDRDTIQKAFQDVLGGITLYDIEHRIIRQNDGEIRCIKSQGSAEMNSNGIPVKMFGTAQDITDIKRVQDQLKSALGQRDLLLKELNHRVKNNMQVIISLIRLQSDLLTDEQAKSAFFDTQNRIHAMSAIHETLYQSENLVNVDLAEYLKRLSRAALQTYGIDDGNILFDLDFESTMVDLEKSYPIGLVVNELLSNSLKHAFPNGRVGWIEIRGVCWANCVDLVISDNGKGMPPNFDWRNADSLGLKIVHSLVEDQLRGKIDLDETSGTKWMIKFPI